MNGKRLRKSQTGQGLVEYALILVLVALVVIVAAFLVGQATQRIFGIVLGATGGKAGTGDLFITDAYCYMDPSVPVTSLVIMGYSTAPISELYASDDLQATNMTGYGGGLVAFNPFTYNSSFPPTGWPTVQPSWQIEPELDLAVRPDLCPTAITVQDGHGLIAVAPVIPFSP